MSQSEMDVKNEENPGTSLEESRASKQEKAPSIVTAMNRLKQTQQKIYEAKRRLQVLQMKNTKIESTNSRKSRILQFKDQVRNFSRAQKQTKLQFHMRRSFQIERYHQKSLNERNRHKEKINELRQSMQERSKVIYQNAKKQRLKYTEAIQKAKQKNLRQKQSHRQKMSQQEKKRQGYLKQFMKNKQLTARLKKQEQAYAIMSRVHNRQSVLHSIQKQGSEASCTNLNPESSKVTQDDTDAKNQTKKGFRVKHYKNNQTTVLLD